MAAKQKASEKKKAVEERKPVENEKKTADEATATEKEEPAAEKKKAAAKKAARKKTVAARAEAPTEEKVSEEKKAPKAPEHTYEELKKKTVAQLREIADKIEHEVLKGHKTMRKEQLVLALSEALGIDAHVHHEVVGLDKAAIKAQIRALKVQRDEALEAHDRARLKLVRRRIHRLKRKIRKAMV
jgi:hypothetical protein